MSALDSMKARINTNSDLFQTYSEKESVGLNHMQTRLNAVGGPNQWNRMRQDKLRGLKKALLYSYQSAVVSIYHPAQQVTQDNQFRCLINHDKLKVDYEDKIISIPFQEPPLGSNIPVETGFKNGTVFKWIHGNKEEWTPDTYWIVYMQYSEETAYFRAEIRKADSEIEIITVNGIYKYRGWITGPNETDILWNQKSGIVWNDLNYTKMLYITKDDNTEAFFKRFDRVVIDGMPWQVQALNFNWGGSSNNVDTGIIRVALKEAYTTTDETIAAIEKQKEESTEISGAQSVYPFDEMIYSVNYAVPGAEWGVSDTSLARVKGVSAQGTYATIEILDQTGGHEFDITYGDRIFHVKIKSF